MNLNKDALINTLKEMPEIIRSYVSNISEYDLDERRKPDCWTVRENLYHVIGIQDMLYERIQKIQKETNPVITPFNPEKDKGESKGFTSLEDAFSYYSTARKKQIALIESLTDADFLKKAEHSEYRNYNLVILLNHVVFHEYWHMHRIEELWNTKNTDDITAL